MGGREGGMEGGREGRKEGGREGWRKRRREGGRGGREGGREEEEGGKEGGGVKEVFCCLLYTCTLLRCVRLCAGSGVREDGERLIDCQGGKRIDDVVLPSGILWLRNVLP